MNKQEVKKEDFEALHRMFGSHSAVARQLGISRPHYHYVRKTGKMSESLARLIALMAKENPR